MQKYEIISLKVKGWSNAEINRQFGVSRNTIAKYWKEYQDKIKELQLNPDDMDSREVIESIVDNPKYDTSSRGPLKYSQDIEDVLLQILEDEKEKTRLLGPTHKQALNRKQIWELLVSMGYNIGYTTIRNRINQILDEENEAFIKQEYEYGERFEYDFGEVVLHIGNHNTKGYLAVLTAPASHFRWAYLYTNSKMDVFLDSQVKFFDMLGGCFKEGVYDNMRNVVSKFIGRNEKELNEQLIKLSIYYGFIINVTNCYSGNEKGTVESAVKWLRNKTFALKYKFDSFQEAQQYLQDKLIEINRDSLIEEEKKYLSARLPKYETAVITYQSSNKYSLIRIDRNDYSVPDSLCRKEVCIKTYPNEIIIKYKGETVAKHVRQYTKEKTYIDIRHYLHTLKKKPGALRNSAALKQYPEFKSIFDLYYREKPKIFIALLKEYEHLSDAALAAVLVENATSHTIHNKDIVEDKTKEEIEKYSTMFIGGSELVN